MRIEWFWRWNKSTNMFEKTLKMYHHEINIFLCIFNDWCLFLFRPSNIKIFSSNCCKTNNDLVHWRPWTPLVFDILRPFIYFTGSWYELCKTVSRTPGPFCYDGGSVEFRTPTVSSSTQNNLQKLKQNLIRVNIEFWHALKYMLYRYMSSP